MTLSDFEEFLVKVITDSGKMVQVPSFLCFLYLSKDRGEATVQYLPTPYQFLVSPRENLKKTVKEILEDNSKKPELQNYELSTIASACPALLLKREDYFENSLLQEIDPTYFEDTKPGMVMVFENQLVSKLVSFPIEDREIVVEKKFEEVLKEEFLVSGILRHIQPVN